MDKLLTQQDLAKRWQVTVRTIENWRKEGVIQTVKGLPAPRFNPRHIAELEGTEISKLSPLERKRLESEIERLKVENEELRSTIDKIYIEAIKIHGVYGYVLELLHQQGAGALSKDGCAFNG